MKRSTLSKMCVAILSCIGLTASLAVADEDERLSVSVAAEVVGPDEDFTDNHSHH
jgi:hypothetical protein